MQSAFQQRAWYMRNHALISFPFSPRKVCSWLSSCRWSLTTDSLSPSTMGRRSEGGWNDRWQHRRQCMPITVRSGGACAPRTRSRPEFSHSLCPGCLPIAYPHNTRVCARLVIGDRRALTVTGWKVLLVATDACSIVVEGWLTVAPVCVLHFAGAACPHSSHSTSLT